MRPRVRACKLGASQWIQGAPIEIASQKGLILLHFWTFGCINCLNVLKDLKRLEYKYPDTLTVISVHTPKFEKEKDIELLKRQIEYLDITHRVVQDRDAKLWDCYAVKAWPTWVLIDADGYIIEHQQGEKKFELFNQQISRLTEEAKPLPESHTEDALVAIEVEGEWSAVATRNTLSIYKGKKKIYLKRGFEFITAMLWDKERLFIADRESGKLYTLNCRSGQISVLKENLRAPWGMDKVGNTLLMTLAGSHKIAQLDLNSGVFKEIAGNGFEGLRDGAGDQVLLAQPSAVSADFDRIWFLDAETSSLRYIQGEEVYTEFGEGLFSYGDSDAKRLLQHPQSMVMGRMEDGCGAGRIFIADSYNGKIKVYNPIDKSMMTLVENLTLPIYISKSGCRLYFIEMGHKWPKVFDLQLMQLQDLEYYETVS